MKSYKVIFQFDQSMIIYGYGLAGAVFSAKFDAAWGKIISFEEIN